MARAKRQTNEDLFGSAESSDLIHAPLAERMRPRSLDEFLGQDHLVGEGRPLRHAIETDSLHSLILWGPPGSGKTTLARIIARHTQAAFEPFSAVVSGVPELRRLIKAAEQRRSFNGQRTILFVDEIHRFNKAQQDAFLPYVEQGVVILVGATTQNPSFELIAPLLSRTMVVLLYPLDETAIGRLLDNALQDRERGLGNFQATVTAEARDRLIRYANGDARAVLSALEYVVSHASSSASGGVQIDREVLERMLLQKSLRYDKDGEEHYNLISAYIKSLRDSDPDAGLYWLARMLEGGEDPRFIARRMVIFASEDIGNADPFALVFATAVFQAVETVGLPEARINLAHGTTFLATRPKENASYVALLEALEDAREYGNLGVPLHLRNAVTSLMRTLGYGQGYRYVHQDPAASQEQPHLPEPLRGKCYYRRKE